MAENKAAYAGDATPNEAWDHLLAGGAVLVDVRTVPEWSYVGVPDLSAAGTRPLLREWQQYPHMGVAEDFVAGLAADIAAAGGGPETPVYFLCRSGVRSRAAAIAMTAAGFSSCYNVAGGFEGGHDSQRHRGTTDGWKAAGLPWVQG